MIEISQLKRDSRVLDYGCGTGIFFEELCEAGFQVVGLDLSPDMLRVAREAHPMVTCLCVDGTDVPVGSGSFDGVFCRGSLHHLPNVSAGLREISRVLRQGGVMVFSEPSNDSFVNRLARGRMYAASNEFHEEDEGFRRNEIMPILKEHGFSVEYSRGFGFLAYTLAGFPDKLDILCRLPTVVSVALTRTMVKIDNFFEMLPGANRLALHWQVRARKVL